MTQLETPDVGGIRNISIRQSDCFELLRSIPSKSVHAVLTDPPYG
jgi:DNA modification methylase